MAIIGADSMTYTVTDVGVYWAQYDADTSAACMGLTADITIVIAGDTAATTTLLGPGGFADYQWYMDGAAISGATADTLIFTHDNSAPGQYYLEYNNGSCVITTDTMTVGLLNAAPDIISDSGGFNNGTGMATDTINENETTVTNVESIDDLDSEGTGNGLTYSLSGPDSLLFTIDDDGNLAFITAPDYGNPMDQGMDNVYNVTVTDNNNCTDTQDFNLTVLGIQEPPLVIPNPLTIPQDSTATICMPILDLNEGDTFTAALCVGSPVNGTATPTVTGNTLCLEYTPTSGYNGTDEICVIVCDQTGLCDTTMVPVTIVKPLPPSPIPEPPVVIVTPITVPEDSTAQVCTVILDSNVGDTFTATLCAGSPANGTATPTVTGNQLCIELRRIRDLPGQTKCVSLCAIRRDYVIR